jgi:hypothetical protein
MIVPRDYLVNTRLVNGRWVPARPENGPLLITIRERIVAVWLVLTGRACAVRWYR